MARLYKKNYLGHENLKQGLQREKNKAILNTGLDDGEAGPGSSVQYAACSYRIGDTIYSLSAGSWNFSDVGTDVATSKYAAFVVLVDSAGAITTSKGAEAASKTLAISALIDVEIPEDKAILGILVVSGAFTGGTTTPSAGTTIDYYSCGLSVAVASGKTAAGDSILNAL